MKDNWLERQFASARKSVEELPEWVKGASHTMSDQTPKEYWERTGDSFTEIKVLKRTVATLTARCEALKTELEHQKAETTRAVLHYTVKGYTAGENADSKHWRERAETAEARCEALEKEKAKLNADIAEFHDIVSGYDAITDPEAFPELHERAFKAIGDDVDHTICRALAAAELRCEVLTAERDKRGEMITHVTDATLAAMERYGGSFVRTLAELYRQGDPDNQATLRHAFGILFAQYAGMADLAKGTRDA